ncbi:MAG: hypothetical protein WBX19_11130 [Terracidiphilus sp.]
MGGKSVFGRSLQCLFHGLDLFYAQRRRELSFGAVVFDAMSCDHEGQGHVQVLMDDRIAPGQSMAPVRALALHDQVMKACGVVPIDGALESLLEHHFQIPVPAEYKFRFSLRCRGCEAPVELGDVVLIWKLVGPF